MKWDKPGIIEKLRKLHKSSRDISYSGMTRQHQSLLSAAAYHFGSYRAAIEHAGIDYSEVVQRPRWTKQRIIVVIKQARRKGEDLHWGAVTQRRDELGRAAFAAMQPRLFGKWDRALHAAGLDADDVACYRSWDKNTVTFEIRSRAQSDEALSSGALQKEDPGLHAAAVRYFGSYDRALRAARLDPDLLRQRRTWTKKEVIESLKKAFRNGDHLSDTAIRRNQSPLYGAAVRLFGSFTAARRAAGVKMKIRGRKSSGKS